LKISIIIPVYNGEKYLAECIESCINQTFNDYEIIVINDGSTDDTVNIATSYKNIKVISKNNGGTGSALNLGIDNMSGDWFKWVSADDVLLPNALEILNKHAVSESTLYYTNYNVINEKSEITSTFLDKQYDHQGANMFNNFYGNGSTSLISKYAFNCVGKFATLPYNEDYEFWLRWTIQNGLKMQYIPHVTLNYRVHSTSLTSTKSVKENQKVVNELRKMYHPLLTENDLEYLKTLQKKSLKKRIGIRFPFLMKWK
jgi:glycosyltransferase involved in cell wall biosynthesis